MYVGRRAGQDQLERNERIAAICATDALEIAMAGR
jgi:hypothetical protein